MVLHFVSKILKEVVPLMEHPSESFLAGLEEDLVKLTMKHGQLVSLRIGVIDLEYLGLSVKNICIKLKGEVGMVVPKSRVVGITTYKVRTSLCLLFLLL